MKLFDSFLWQRALDGSNGAYYKSLHEGKIAALPMQQMNWYPYTGAHIKGNVNHFGPIPLESTEFYNEMEYRAGKHGFFTEIDVDNPPPTPPNVFRIILIGGSSAQGWGAQYDREMLYRILPEELNRRFSARGLDTRVELLNLAMAGSITYQNYIALNIWGRKYKPDLILSYSGGNDLLVPFQYGSDAPLSWSTVQSYARSLQFDYLGPSYKSLAAWFPGIIRTTSIGRMIQYLEISSSDEDVLYRYQKERGMLGLDRVNEIAQPLYAHAFQSIKRDFLGIPILIAFQPIDFRMLPESQWLGDEYWNMIDKTIAETREYINDEWHYVNLRRFWNEQNLWSRGKLGNGLHLPTIFQKIVSDQLADKLEPLILRLVQKNREQGR